MATLPALVKAITEVDGRDHKTIEHTARLIREAGYIPTGKRGGGAAEMDFIAAANLLIGLNGADSPKDAEWAIGVIRFLRGRGFSDNESLPDIFREVGSADTFGEALALLIQGAPELVAIGKDFIDRAYHEKSRKFEFSEMLRGSSGIRFIVNIERTFATISCFTPDFKTPVQWQARYYLDLESVSDSKAREYIGRLWGRDRKVSTKIGLPTLLKVWACIEGVDAPEPQTIEQIEAESAL